VTYDEFEHVMAKIRPSALDLDDITDCMKALDKEGLGLLNFKEFR
jgi:hypothetical protein